MTASNHLCAICGTLLLPPALRDYWGNLFCARHQHELSPCTSCGRLICERLTDGGFYYPDGLVMCGLCDRRGIFSEDRAILLLKEMRDELKKNGLDLGNTQTPIRLVDRNELFRRSRRASNEGHMLLGLTRGMITRVGQKVIKRQFMEILVQRGLPEEQFRQVAIHELCHAWIFYRGIHFLPLEVEEGLCVLSEYLWLKRQNTPQAAFWRFKLLKNRDPIYGAGFRKALKAMERMPMPRMMRYVQKKKKLPGFWASLLWT